MALPTSIPEVLTALNEIVEECKAANSRSGYFAFIYRETTARIAAGIEQQHFEDNERMIHFDVRFANYYIQAYRDFKAGKPVAKPWKTAFLGAAESLTLIQHILLGMNAHINLDLALTASEVMKNKNIHAIKTDFYKVNELLFSLTDEFQERISRVSPLFFLLDWFGKNTDEQIINFSMEKARSFSWANSVLLWTLADEHAIDPVSGLEQTVDQLGQRMQRPQSRFVRGLLQLIGYFETKEVSRVLEKINA
ncbi:DUF5995 family protein [Croceiramulus getboli]|nr:DUF5995 family protein [Flavobacteriaceae bacterium YJPT1-3]